MHNAITDDLEALLEALPPSIHEAVDRLENRGELLEIVMDLGRLPEARFPDGEVILSDQPITYADLEYVVEHIGEFGDDNRAGIERTLHRISALRNRKGRVVGLTCRIGRAVLGSIALIRDIVEQGQSILILGRPGVGKTTLLREIARVLADEANKRVVVVDTSNEIAGDGDIPHPGIGRARRMQVAHTSMQHAVMIEAVENHMPQVIVIDEIGTELEAQAARTIAERGVQLIATAHGNSLSNLLVNPTLSDLVGGIQTVTLGDEEARRRHTQKSILERKAPPTFDVVVEQQSWQELIVHRDVAETVDNLLRGQPVIAEVRTRDEETGRVSVRRVTIGGMELPAWGSGSGSLAGRQGGYLPFERSAGGWNNLRQLGQVTWRDVATAEPLRRNGQSPLPALAPSGLAANLRRSPSSSNLVTLSSTAPALASTSEEALTTEEDSQQALTLSPPRPIRIYPFGVNRDRLEQAARQLGVPVIITKNENEANAIITLKNYYRRQPERLQQAADDQKTIIILKNNTVAQMQHALARIFALPEEEDDEGGSGSPGSLAGLAQDEETRRALLEAEDAIHRLLNHGLTAAELAPANAYVRRLQHQLASRYNLFSRSRGKEPNRRVKIFRS
ncbi:R3H domain-containing nucleic acid-binding protein [Thermogemmatispora onikobensis]|uniref:R3H domain-containing nucleic acid-binding protein n=1 Tax=Thermogemmatispora onikobensis TaxID=732234 RepID=UPI000852CA58|nr:R3H domain-containing nucleic acid-binding protein [Thermogemmatispora onikobensis]